MGLMARSFAFLTRSEQDGAKTSCQLPILAAFLSASISFLLFFALSTIGPSIKMEATPGPLTAKTNYQSIHNINDIVKGILSI
jgi:hypothetical protein